MCYCSLIGVVLGMRFFLKVLKVFYLEDRVMERVWEVNVISVFLFVLVVVEGCFRVWCIWVDNLMSCCFNVWI